MRRWIVLLAVAAFLSGATPAGAVWKGQVCKDFRGPDGDFGVHLYACLVVDDHDFQDQIRALIFLSNPGNGRAEVHASYLKLIKNNLGDVKNTGPFVVASYPDQPHAWTTTWHSNPNGTFHSRIRMWVCWPTLAGDPCGSIVVWNSGNASY